MSPSEKPSSSEWGARGSFFFVEWVFSVFELSIFLFSSHWFYGINELDNYFMVFIASYAAVMYTTYWACVSNKKPRKWNYLNGCSLHIMHMLFVVASPLSFSWEDGGHSSCFILVIHCITQCIECMLWWICGIHFDEITHFTILWVLSKMGSPYVCCSFFWMLWYTRRALIYANKHINGEGGRIVFYLIPMNFISNGETSMDKNWKLSETGNCAFRSIAEWYCWAYYRQIDTLNTGNI